MAGEDKIQVLIVDDTVIYRKILADAVASLPETEVIGTAPSGTLALRKMEQARPDLVLLDVFMPEMDGVETLRHIRQSFPDTAVVMVSGATTRDAEVTIQALELGALDFIPKPTGAAANESMRQIADNLRRVLRLLSIRRLARRPALSTAAPAAPTPPPPPRVSVKPANFGIVVIGVSTGGPNALAALVPRLPANLGCPVLIVQHMPPHFTASLAQHLSHLSALPVREAQDNELVAANTVLIAPGGRHMTVRADPANATQLLIALNDSPPVNSCRPAVDVLFRSVAAHFNGGILSVILTGMGEDGAAGVAALKRKSCWSLAQDEKTCVVYGMPRALVERGLADEVVPLDALADRITALVKRRL